MLQRLTRESFAKHLNENFRLCDAPASMDLVLIEARALGSDDRQRRPQPVSAEREPFSLIFQGAKAPVLDQRIYNFEHGDMGSLAFFIVPVGQTETATLYQAIFN